jgi:heme-degrading monooxygenase HmoA
MAETWLRVATYASDGSGSDEFLEYMESSIHHVVRRLEKQTGFRGGHWGHDPETGTIAAVTHWASRAAIENAAAVFEEVAADRAAHGIKSTGATNLCLFTSPTTWEQQDWAAITGGTAANWLRVALYRPERSEDECAEYLRTSTRAAIDMLERQPGFRAGYWGHDPVEGTMAAVTYWDGQDAIVAAGGELERLHRERWEHGVRTETIVNLRLFPAPASMAEVPHGWLA